MAEGAERQILKFTVPRSPEMAFSDSSVSLLLDLYYLYVDFYWFKTCNWYKLQKSLQFPLIFVFYLAISPCKLRGGWRLALGGIQYRNTASKFCQLTTCVIDKILISTSLDKNFITAGKSITKLVIFQIFVAKCCKMRII
jgi:hypothetical protein